MFAILDGVKSEAEGTFTLQEIGDGEKNTVSRLLLKKKMMAISPIVLTFRAAIPRARPLRKLWQTLRTPSDFTLKTAL